MRGLQSIRIPSVISSDGKNSFGVGIVRNHGGEWWVNKDGILEGKGGGDPGYHTVLVSDERRNFTNFVLRVEYRLQAGGGRFVIRHSGSDDVMTGYQIQGFSAGRYPIGRIGRATFSEDNMGDEAEHAPFADDQWHTMEIAAIGNRVATSMQETGSLDFQVDSESMYKSGQIALMCFALGHVQVKEVLLKELPDEPDASRPMQRGVPSTKKFKP